MLTNRFSESIKLVHVPRLHHELNFEPFGYYHPLRQLNVTSGDVVYLSSPTRLKQDTVWSQLQSSFVLQCRVYLGM